MTVEEIRKCIITDDLDDVPLDELIQVAANPKETGLTYGEYVRVSTKFAEVAERMKTAITMPQNDESQKNVNASLRREITMLKKRMSILEHKLDRICSVFTEDEEKEKWL